MNSVKYFFISLISVYSLTLNEKALESQDRSWLAHRSQQMLLQSDKNILNVEEALAQLRVALNAEKVDLAQNKTHLQAEGAKSLILSSVSRKPTEDKQSSTSKNLKRLEKTTKDRSNRQATSDYRFGTEAAWAQSGGGCHSMVTQFAYMHAFVVPLKLWVKKIVQGETMSSPNYLAMPHQQSVSSGGAWGVFSATAAVWDKPVRSFTRRSEISYVDAIIVPNENLRNWQKIIRHNIEEQKKSSASLIRKGDKGMSTYENMIQSSLNFYLQVRKDPSLKDLAAQDIFQAELAAQVSKAGPEVRAIAAQYDVTPSSHPALLAAIKKTDTPPTFHHPDVRSIVTPDCFTGDSPDTCSCDVMDNSWFVKCDADTSFQLFGGAVTCVAKPSETDGTKQPWGWVEVVYRKFLKPWDIKWETFYGYGEGDYTENCLGLCPKNTFEKIVKGKKDWFSLPNMIPDGDTVMVTTVVPVENLGEIIVERFDDGTTKKISSAKIRFAQLMARPTGDLPQVLAETSNFGLSLLYLFYYSKVYLGCGPNIGGAIQYALDKNISKKFKNSIQSALGDVVSAPESALTWVFDAFMETNYLPPTRSFYFLDYAVLESEEFLFDGMSADNNAVVPLIMMIAQDQKKDGLAYDITPSIMVTSTGDDEFDFMSIAQYFLDTLPLKYAPPAVEVAISMSYLCEESKMHEDRASENYMLKYSGACITNPNCGQYLWDWYIEGAAPGEYGNDSLEKTQAIECLLVHNEENIWSKVKKTGILYLQELHGTDTFFETQHGHFGDLEVDAVYLSAMVFAMTVKNDMAQHWMLDGFGDEAGEFPNDVNLQNFPTFGKSSLMNVPLHYAFLLTSYVTHLTWVQMNCLSGDDNKCDSGDKYCDCASMRCDGYYPITFAFIPQLSQLGDAR